MAQKDVDPIHQARKKEIRSIEECFRVLYIDNKPEEIYIPACVQFKIKDFTEVNFESLSAQVNGVLCVSFLIFTHDKNLQAMLLERLYWNPQEQQIITKNRRKKVERTGNYIPIMFNKDINIKIPTTRTKEFQIQSFKTKVLYKKRGTPIQGWRVYHVIRKEFKVEILKSNFWHAFIAPYNLINLDLTITLDHMDVELHGSKKSQEETYVRALNRKIFGEKKYDQYEKDIIQQILKKQQLMNKEQVMMIKPEQLMIKKIHFNILRIQQSLQAKNLSIQNKVNLLSPMITSYVQSSFSKYDIAESKLQAYTFDQREILNLEDTEDNYGKVLQDESPIQLGFKPFKYSIFKMPLYRFPVIDMMTIFVPLYVLAFISVFIFYQSTEIMNRILNISALMVAYAAIQPMVRENLPDATGLTLVDLLIYMSLLVNILFLIRSISVRTLFDEADSAPTPSQSNINYSREQDALFIISVILTLLNFAVVTGFICVYLYKKKQYKCDIAPKRKFEISNQQNWTIKLLMGRSFARYRNQLNKLDEINKNGVIPQDRKTKLNHPYYQA